MRGSVYYQSSQLVKQIFQEGAKKEDKINPNHEYYQMVSSFKTIIPQNVKTTFSKSLFS